MQSVAVSFEELSQLQLIHQPPLLSSPLLSSACHFLPCLPSFASFVGDAGRARFLKLRRCLEEQSFRLRYFALSITLGKQNHLRYKQSLHILEGQCTHWLLVPLSYSSSGGQSGGKLLLPSTPACAIHLPCMRYCLSLPPSACRIIYRHSL